MNKELLKLYESKWTHLSNAILKINKSADAHIKPTNPLLIGLEKESEYSKSAIRVMFFGKETNDWCNTFEPDLKTTIANYKDFFFNERCYQLGTHFWNGIKRLQLLLDNKYPKQKKSYVWNNIIKIGRLGERGRPPREIYDLEREYFPVIKAEIEILQPNVVIFLTGPSYDDVLRDNFGPVELQPLRPFSERQLSSLKLTGVQNAFRTYHPNYLWRHKIDSLFQEDY